MHQVDEGPERCNLRGSVGCMLSTVSPQAFDHNIGPLSIAWRGDLEEYLGQGQPRYAPNPRLRGISITVLAHGLPIRPGKFWPQSADAIIKFLYLRFS